MRTAFIKTLFAEAQKDERIMLVVGDLGFGVVVEFRDALPNQFLNAGVSEQNMTGIAAGLALSNKKVFTYSIANFSTLRCIEQIRNDVCYHNANVTIVSVGGGMAYGNLGYSHHAVEDIAILRALHNMTVVVPGDPVEARLATKALLQHDGPAYLRLARDNDPIVHETEPHFELGKAIAVRDGQDITLIAAGSLVYNAKVAANMLAEQGIQARILSMHTVKPIDVDAIVKAAQETHAILTIEDHSVIGGLGSAVAEVLMESGVPTLFKRLGLEGHRLQTIVGNQEYMREQLGLHAEGIAAQAHALLAQHTAKRAEATEKAIN